MDLQALIFDMDGVIIDTLEYHFRAWQRLCHEQGLTFDQATNDRLRGLSRHASLKLILAGSGQVAPQALANEWLERKNAYFLELAAALTPADVLPGVVELMVEAHAAGLKVGVGSASRNAVLLLGRLKVLPLLDAVVDSRTIDRSKPAPDVFLRAAELLGAAPAGCVVFEDGEAGVEAALAAGMWVVGLGPAERVGQAHVRFNSLAGVNLGDVRAALKLNTSA